MSKNLTTLQSLVSQSGNCVNLGRSMQVKHPELFDWVCQSTPFLPLDCKFTERVYCLLNGITERVRNEDGVTFSLFKNMFRGYCVLRLPAAKPAKVERVKPVRRTKLEEYIARNKKTNAHLYAEDMVHNVDYVICPVSQVRMVLIRVDYIEKVLGMTEAEYTEKYPDVLRAAPAHSQKLSNALRTVDASTGFSAIEIAAQKRKETMRQVGEDGLTGNQRLGQRTRETHMNNVDEFGRNGYQRQVHKRLTTVLDNGLTVEQNAHIKQRETLAATFATGTGGASKQSIRALAPILDFLDENEINYYFDKTEYSICDTSTGLFYSFDLTIPEFKMAIEYQSSAWHADPTLPDELWESWAPPRGKLRTAKEVLEYDYTKARALWRLRGIATYYVWQKTEKKDVEDLLCLLRTHGMRY